MSAASNARPPQARRPHARPRARLLGAAALLSAALSLIGCGAAAKHAASTTATHTPATTTSLASTTPAARTTTSVFRSNATGPVVYAKCMRANRVAKFPDPNSGAGSAFRISTAVSSSPAFRTATVKCEKYMGGQAGFQSNPSKHTMAKLLKIANCMRAHDIHQFPDPLYTRPMHFTPGKYQEITDFDGATLLFPTNMDLQAPAYRRALSACGAPPLGLPH
ncbi:MAG TPA: hypothetical protein VG293_09785 [Solirubrobacteraceae bacterium]|nr:hypothetical protein [Solirubrobacteraceae bacterium]